jgi:glycosyltransferase involved in cell wall biosynthesis
VRLGWIGSAGTLPYLRRLERPLRTLAQRGVDVELLVVGVQGRSDLLPDVPQRLDVVESYTAAELPTLAARLDVGLLPLDDGPWERGKCAMKALVYMAAARPVVCSPVGENVHVVRDGEAGYAAADDAAWVEHLERLAGDAELRDRLGAAGRRAVDLEYSTEVCFGLLLRHVFAAA